MDANKVSKSMVVEIKNNQTALVMSRGCNETMVIVNNPKKAYGAETHIINEVNDLEKIELACKKAGFSDNFVYFRTDGDAQVFISMESGKGTLPVAIGVIEHQEGNEVHLKLCKVLVEDYARELERER